MSCSWWTSKFIVTPGSRAGQGPRAGHLCAAAAVALQEDVLQARGQLWEDWDTKRQEGAREAASSRLRPCTELRRAVGLGVRKPSFISVPEISKSLSRPLVPLCKVKGAGVSLSSPWSLFRGHPSFWASQPYNQKPPSLTALFLRLWLTS